MRGEGGLLTKAVTTVKAAEAAHLCESSGSVSATTHPPKSSCTRDRCRASGQYAFFGASSTELTVKPLPHSPRHISTRVDSLVLNEVGAPTEGLPHWGE